MAEHDQPEAKEGELIPAAGFLPVLRYSRGDETRTYNVLVVPDGAELWAVTEAIGKVPRVVKEGLFISADEALKFLDEVHRTLIVGGWQTS
jgi:hypothetical protein